MSDVEAFEMIGTRLEESRGRRLALFLVHRTCISDTIDLQCYVGRTKSESVLP
jgi:hypothetical protein